VDLFSKEKIGRLLLKLALSRSDTGGLNTTFGLKIAPVDAEN
jgi:hypothetical protein